MVDPVANMTRLSDSELAVIHQVGINIFHFVYLRRDEGYRSASFPNKVIEEAGISSRLS